MSDDHHHVLRQLSVLNRLRPMFSAMCDGENLSDAKRARLDNRLACIDRNIVMLERQLSMGAITQRVRAERRRALEAERC
ncbi:MAG: hypothetical protein JWR21_92 [Herminiimonas sp.]|nr:hypothetical protein [Herminiimonas sp.]